MLIRDDKSRILPARTGSLRTTRLVPSAAPLVVTATTRGSGTGVPPVTAEDTEHGDLKPAPDPAAGESRSRAWRTLRPARPRQQRGRRPPQGCWGTGGGGSAGSAVRLAPRPRAASSSRVPRPRQQPPRSAPLPASASRRRARSVCPTVSPEFRAWRQRGPLPASLGDSPSPCAPTPRGRGAATLPGPCSCSRPPRVLPPGGPPLGGADTQRLPRLAAGAEPRHLLLGALPSARRSPAGRPAAPRPRRSLLRASPPARPVSLERAVSSSPRAKRLASDGGSGGRLGSALLTLHSIRGTNVARSNKTLFTGTGRARFRPQASFLAPAVLPTARVVTSACRCDFRHSVCSLKSPARIPWRSV